MRTAFLASIALTLWLPFCFGSPSEAKVQETNISIDADDITLAATLHMPEKCPPEGCTAVVLGHGSAPTTRKELGFYRRIAMSLGFAVLAYDKRGTGESTGTYEPFRVEISNRVFNVLANDMRAATEWLAKQPRINSDDIGLFGGSQAGWIMPLAVNLGAPAKFIVVGEGATVAAGREAIHGQMLVALKGSESTPNIDHFDRHMADVASENFSGDLGYDPAPVMEQLNIPVLWLFGLRDDVIPVQPSLRVLEKYIAAGHRNHSVHIFPFGDHNFSNRATGGRYDLAPIIRQWRADTAADKR